MSTAFLYVPPDIFISGDGKHVAVKLDGGKMAMIKGRSTTFDAQSWARSAIEQSYVEKDDIPMNCDDKGCIVTVKGRKIALLKDAAALADECSLSDIIIIDVPVSPAMCNAVIIDKSLLDKGGGAALWIQDSKITLKQTRSTQGKRPWTL
jgi:competence protein ComEC